MAKSSKALKSKVVTFDPRQDILCDALTGFTWRARQIDLKLLPEDFEFLGGTLDANHEEHEMTLVFVRADGLKE